MFCYKVKFPKSIWNSHWYKILVQRPVLSTIFPFDLTYTTSNVENFTKSVYTVLESFVKNVRFLDKESSSQKKSYTIWDDYYCQKRKMQSRTVIVLDLVAKKLKLFVISVKLLDAVLSFFLWLCIISAEGVGTKTNEWRRWWE